MAKAIKETAKTTKTSTGLYSEKTITEFMDNEYKDYSVYVIENRAFPSVIDGFKPTQRKVIYVSSKIWKNLDNKDLKVFQLSGRVAADAFYHAGSISMEEAITGMAQSFKNNLPLMDGIGQFGNLRDPEAGAARYISTKLNKNFNLIYKDAELLENQEEEGNIIEPKFYLPIIPMVIVNGGSGLAPGFKTDILNRDASDVVAYIKNKLQKKKTKIELTPKINQFNGTWERDAENPKKWYAIGRFERTNTTTINITELEPKMSYQDYEKILNEMVAKKEIASYDNNSKGDVNYSIKISREDLAKLDDEKLRKKFKLISSYTEIYGTLDEHGKLKIFETIEELVDYFISFRLTYYQKRKVVMSQIIERDIVIMSNKIKFITAITTKKLNVNNVPIKTIEDYIEKTLKLEKVDDTYNYLTRLPLYNLTIEMIEKLKNEIESRKEELSVLKSKSDVDLYLADLEDLSKNLK